MSIMAADTVQLPHINYAALAPMLILFGGAAVGVLVEAFVARRSRYGFQVVVGLGSLVAALVMVIREASVREITAGGAIAVDGPALFLEGTLTVLGIVALLLVAERSLESRRHPPQDGRLSGRSEWMVLNGAYLVDADRVDDFADLVQELAPRHPGIQVELTGPWPPYSFTSADEREAAVR